MAFWRRSPQPDAAPVKRTLEPLGERVWLSVRLARWRRGTEHFIGRHGAHFLGFAAHASASRPYVPGDDTRFLNERLFARTDRDFVKLDRIEASLRCLLLLDGTRSMAHGGKFSLACQAAWVGANLFSNLGDSFGLHVCGPSAVLPYGRGTVHVQALKGLLETLEPGGDAGVAEDLRAAAPRLRGATVGVVLSDFIAPGQAIFRALAALAESGADLVLVQILTQEEQVLPFTGELVFRDPESSNSIQLDADAVGSAYRRLVTHQRAMLDRFARDRGFPFYSIDPARDTAADLWQQILCGQKEKRLW